MSEADVKPPAPRKKKRKKGRKANVPAPPPRRPWWIAIVLGMLFAGVTILCLSTIPLGLVGAHTSIVAISVVRRWEAPAAPSQAPAPARATPVCIWIAAWRAIA